MTRYIYIHRLETEILISIIATSSKVVVDNGRLKSKGVVSTLWMFFVEDHIYIMLINSMSLTVTYIIVHVGSSVINGYGERTWPVHIIDINCTGLESSIWDCPHNAIQNYDCRSRYRDAAVTCVGKQYTIDVYQRNAWLGNIIMLNGYTKSKRPEHPIL